jgi:hypothetical protein
MQLGLIHLLITENYLFVEDKHPRTNHSEGDSDHYSQLIGVVTSLDDERAIPVGIAIQQRMRCTSNLSLRLSSRAP